MAEGSKSRTNLRKELVETLSAELLIDGRAELEQYITHPKGLIFDDLDRTQRHWHRTPNPYNLFDIRLSPLNTELKVKRSLKTGSLLGFHEVDIEHVGATAQSSTSMARAPGKPADGIKGNASNLPFWPGGMEEPSIDDLLHSDGFEEIDFENGLLKVPPGFEFGMDLDNLNDDPLGVSNENAVPVESVNELNLTKLLLDDENDLYFKLSSENYNTEMEEEFCKPFLQKENYVQDECDKILEASVAKLMLSSPIDILAISKEPDVTNAPLGKTEWAEMVNINKTVEDFDRKVPTLAHMWPFELDTFQKQAILHLEKKESVFVAAHTSAGKTVVAEYAVALSMKHLTKTVYTSPIKALSNQKFREFKKTFKDVGLITGDIQLSPESACLIMTTEILRSMLYNGSDTIRDLEWVIFDEVHYINDNERGVVWEEVIILIPKHVNIVLLSATVPNALEFADWIGRTKKQKIYVISTPKRPVPLEHYLYIGTNVKAQNELYMIVGSDSKFKVPGYNAAKDAHTGFKKDQGGAGKPGIGGYVPHLTLKQERNIWLNILNLLKKKDQLPVVVFTFSRKLCDQNAQMLTSLDLTSSSEKNKIHEFTMRCMQRLKNDDTCIPQVKNMRELLMRGIGIHHSGILPILKEVVEMLFQEGVVKLLFATETFAMGVNMPARTVVFDSIAKYDGFQRRTLRPEEYIQMAGRAGRRGLDSKGMVIILCKSQLPERCNLEIMIQGKPTLLESRFRLTYSMILNLLRVEKLPVAEMMKRSFSEIGMQKKVSHYEKRLISLTEKESALAEVDCNVCGSSLDDYYNVCLEYVRHYKELLKLILNHPLSTKALCPGRVLVVAKQDTLLGVIVKSTKSINNQNPGPVLHILVAVESEVVPETAIAKERLAPGTRVNLDALWMQLFNARKVNVCLPGAAPKYDIIKCDVEDIIQLTADVITIDGDKVYKDWDRRQIPRFNGDTPSGFFVAAAQELAIRLQKSSDSLSKLEPMKDLHIKDVDVCDKWGNLQRLHERLNDFQCIKCVEFEDHLKTLHANRKLKEELSTVKYHLSDESLKLQPEYKARIEVLKALRYIDNLETVLLKGRVACEISNHELVTTELVFENVLTNFQPAEIAALLSCMVCQEKRQRDGEEPALNHALMEGKKQILDIVRTVDKLQKENGIVEEKFEEQYRFELAEVVYEWARGMPFAEIMNLTEIQEGIIVRCIQRLDEILRDVKDAARMVGDPALYQKMDAASQAIKRDIVFAASLYTQ